MTPTNNYGRELEVYVDGERIDLDPWIPRRIEQLAEKHGLEYADVAQRVGEFGLLHYEDSLATLFEDDEK